MGAEILHYIGWNQKKSILFIYLLAAPDLKI